MNAPVRGRGCSGVAVATIIRSISAGVRPARLIAAAAALVPRLAVVSSGPATRRSRIPVRSTIHSSLVSTRASRSALVRRPSGSAVPQPTIDDAMLTPSRDPQPGDGLAFSQPFARVREKTHQRPAERAPHRELGAGADDLTHYIARADRRAFADVGGAEHADGGRDDETFRNSEPFAVQWHVRRVHEVPPCARFVHSSGAPHAIT